MSADSVPTLSLVQNLSNILIRSCGKIIEEEKKRVRSFLTTSFLTFKASHSERVLAFAEELQSQIKTRFTYDDIPDEDGYVAIDLIAQWLDPRTKNMRFLTPEQRDTVTAEVKRYRRLILQLFITSPLPFSSHFS